MGPCIGRRSSKGTRPRQFLPPYSIQKKARGRPAIVSNASRVQSQSDAGLSFKVYDGGKVRMTNPGGQLPSKHPPLTRIPAISAQCACVGDTARQNAVEHVWVVQSHDSLQSFASTARACPSYLHRRPVLPSPGFVAYSGCPDA